MKLTRTGNFSNWRSVVAFSVLAALPLGALAGKPSTSSVPLTTYIYSPVVDEQDTDAYFGGPGHCPAGNTEVARMTPDNVAVGPSSAWNFSGFFSPWTAAAVSSGTYDNGQNCRSDGSCLKTDFSTSNKNFTLDMRTTAPLRKVTLDFTVSWDLILNAPSSNTPSFGPTLSTTGLLQVLGSESFTTMDVCTSKGCPEAREIAAKFWFTDPTAADVTWRVDWRHIRVLRVSQSVWYFIAGACDGSQVAGLSKLVGNRTRPRETLNGYFLMPMFFAAELK